MDINEKSYQVFIEYDNDASSYETFKDIASLMLSIDNLNNAIAQSFGNDIETQVVIKDIQKGSIKIWLSDKLKSIPDNKIKAYVNNPREAISDLLIHSKHVLLQKLDTSPQTLNEEAPLLLDDIIKNSPFRDYGYKIHKTRLLEAISDLSQSAKRLPYKPKIFIEGNNMMINSGYKFNIEDMEDVSKQTHKTRQNFTIKKPDLVSDSKWTIIFDRNIEVKILDTEWLKKLKNREVSISCGDMLDALLRIETYLDEDMNIVETKYFIDEVYDVVPPKNKNAQQLIDSEAL